MTRFQKKLANSWNQKNIIQWILEKVHRKENQHTRWP